MIQLLRKLAVKTKLLSSFLLLASFVLILGVTALFIQSSFKKNQKETLASINLSDAFFEGKYFLRSDMHIYTELEKTWDKATLDYWWGEHQFQITFFNDQLKKIENEFLINKSFDNDTLQRDLLRITSLIKVDYDKKLLPVFNEYWSLKETERNLRSKLSEPNLDSTQTIKINNELKLLQEKYYGLDRDVTDYGLAIIKNLDRGKDMVRVVINEIEARGQVLMKRSFTIYTVFTILGVLFSLYVAVYISNLITKPVNKILTHVHLLAMGEHPELLEIVMEDEFGAIQKSLNNLTDLLVKTSDFSKEIGGGNFESEFSPMSTNDVLGNSLLQMRDSLKKSRMEEDARRIEDERRNWAATGIGKFGDIMRQSGQSLEALSYKLMSNLIDYIDAVQGALFVVNEDDPDNVCYDLISAIAYNRNKKITKSIKPGEGLVGRVIYEEKTIYLKEVPQDYVSITSGLGEASPTTILLVPIKLEDKINGVIELISFNEFAPYQIDFIEKVGENIASFVSSIKINQKTAMLLNESQHKSEELAAQEEEMRQNMEELQATQEEAGRRDEERSLLWDSLGKFMGIIETDLKGNITNSNTKLNTLLGLGANDVSKMNYKTLFFSAADQNFDSLWAKVLAGNAVSDKTTWKDTVGEINLHHELTLVTDADGKSNKVLALIKEVS